jgi:diguanylate cyclase (GGDEF)-like protein
MPSRTNAPLTLLAPGLEPAAVDGLRGLGWVVYGDTQGSPELSPSAVLVVAADAAALRALLLRQDLAAMALDSAWVVQTPVLDAALEAALIEQGVEAIVNASGPAAISALSQQLHHAVQRKRHERAARTAYATDVATGLPHQAQLLEHLTQLLALREREPACMVLLVLKMQGLAQVVQRLGAESANVLRRKVAVRLRSGLRASDVVATISADAFGVLLGRLESTDDAGRVVAKLMQSLQSPFAVAGEPYKLQASVGMALYPEHGNQAEALIKRASAQAASVAAMGLEGYGALVQGLAGEAANDRG